MPNISNQLFKIVINKKKKHWKTLVDVFNEKADYNCLLKT